MSATAVQRLRELEDRRFELEDADARASSITKRIDCQAALEPVYDEIRRLRDGFPGASAQVPERHCTRKPRLVARPNGTPSPADPGSPVRTGGEG